MSDQTRSDPTSKEDDFCGKQNEKVESQEETTRPLDQIRKDFKRNLQKRKCRTYGDYSYYFVK
jgi:hypothetical protein